MDTGNLFERFGIGCANWNQEYNGSVLSDKEIDSILGYCQSCGIDMLDMATAYGNDFSRPNSYFKKVVKVRKGDDIESLFRYEPYCLMAHGDEHWPYLKTYGLNHGFHNSCSGISTYSLDVDANWFRVIQAPYSLYDRRFESLFPLWAAKGIEIHVRSVFLRGRIIEDGVPAEECIKFCLCNPHVDRVILGVDSVEQLQRNLDFIWKWNGLEKHDKNLLDPRQWQQKKENKHVLRSESH